MLVNVVWRICLSVVKIHILTNFHYSSINIVVNKLFDRLDLLTLPIGTRVTLGTPNTPKFVWWNYITHITIILGKKIKFDGRLGNPAPTFSQSDT